MKGINIRLLLLFCMFPALVLCQELRLIKGKITDGNQPLADVEISLEGNSDQLFTAADGSYEIEAKPGDVISFKYNGMKEVRIRVEDVTRFLSFVMVPDYVELDEITVSRRLKSQTDMEQQYKFNQRIIRTAFGYLDADNAAGRIRIIDGNAINPIGVCILDYLRNRFSGVTVVGGCNSVEDGYVVVRNVGSLGNPVPAIYDIDGQIFDQTPIWLDINQIERLAILSTYSLTTRYGQFAAGGVIVINTVNGVSSFVGGAQKRGPEVRALAKTEIEANDPSYLKSLRSSVSASGAQEVYNLNASKYSASPYFFLDAYDYFYSQRQDRDFADRIITENFGRFNNNPVVLKALAYLYQEQGRYEKAVELYKEIFILRPSYSQSYYDMAMAYSDAREIRKAAAMFGRYQYLLQEDFLMPSDHLWLIQQHDSDNLFQREGEKLGTDMRLVTRDDYVQNATRLLLEWNDSEAEFELQFVDPNNKTFNWSHTLADNADRIEDEKIAGYSMEEYVIDPATPGPWQMNVKYLGNKNLNPTYLKLTVWYHFGTKNQQKVVYTFKLRLKGTNQQLITLNNPGTLQGSN